MMNRTQNISNIGSRAGSIDNQLKKFIAPTQMLKGCKKPADIKTQSVIVGQTNDIQYGYQTTKNTKFFNNDLNGKKC